MHPFPHRYQVSGAAQPEGTVQLSSAGLPSLATAPPAEFDGPGDAWSPETLLVGAVANCFILSFRSVAAASRMPWLSLSVGVEGELDRVEKVTQFTQMRIHAALVVPADVTVEQAERLLQRAESVCLISNSLKASVTLTTAIRVA